MHSYKQFITQKVHSQIRNFFLISIFYFLISASSAHAATLSLDPDSGNYGPGDMFVVTLRLDTAAGECINAASIELLYPTDWVKVTAVSKGESLLTLWTDEPLIDGEHGKLTFSGGIPAGYCGRVQGDPGKTNIIAKVVFGVPGNMIGGKTATGPVPMNITFGSSTRVLLNDGFGSPAELKLKNATFTHVLNSSGIKNEWLDIVHADTIPPDEFKVTIAHDSSTFDGRYFIVFLAVDKQSGVHHYEVREDDPVRLGITRGKNEKASFVVATSPYVLKDQELKSRVTVRAIDNAGNVQESILAPSGDVIAAGKGSQSSSSSNKGTPLWWALGAVVVVLILGLVSWLYTRRERATVQVVVNTENDEPEA